MKYGIRDIYKHYKSTVEKPVSFKTFRDAWQDFAKLTMHDIAYEARDFHMPARVGILGIRKKKIIVTVKSDGKIDKRSLRPDWISTKNLWKRDPEAKARKQIIFHLNKHFGGYNCKWFWDKSTCLIPNETAYSLVMTRGNKRMLNSAIQTGDVDYYEQKPKVYGRSNQKAS